MTFEGVFIPPVSDGEPPQGFQREAVGPVSCLENSWTVASVKAEQGGTVSNSQEGGCEGRGPRGISADGGSWMGEVHGS